MFDPISVWPHKDILPAPSAHREYWEQHNNPYVYEYDPTDDGPETLTARVIIACHTDQELATESLEYYIYTIFCEVMKEYFL